MTAFTPGPWTLHPHDLHGLREIVDASTRRVARAYGLEDGIDNDARDREASANARPIAAAPDLYEALRELVSRCDGDAGVRADGSNIETMQAHAALDKVEGAQP